MNLKRLNKPNAPTFLPDDWRLMESGFTPSTQAVSETLMAQANGYLGTRGTFEEPVAPGTHSIEGTYLNGVYLREPIHYDESAFGFASHNNKMILVPDAKRVTLTAGGETFVQGDSELDGQMRVLDMRDGMLTRTSRWVTPNGMLKINCRRFVSMAEPGLMVIDYQVNSVDFVGPVSLTTGVGANYGGAREGFDPRAGALSVGACLDNPVADKKAGTTLVLHDVRDSEHVVASAYQLNIESDAEILESKSWREDSWATCLEGVLSPGQSLRVIKFVGYGDFDKASKESNTQRLIANLTNWASTGFDTLYRAHKTCFDSFWSGADISVDSDDPVEQGIRFGQYHLFTSVGKDGKRALGAKGLTGPGYDGHYFWDTEIYAVPFFVFTDPAVARSLIEYRIGTLDAARTRAREMGHKSGALFPWRTIGGEECSSFFPAGTAQYHINAAIAYAAIQYVLATGDSDLWLEGGAELLFETARLWMGLGHFSAHKGDAFCIHEVTGPDEYTAMVDNNLYTNMMAQHHLREAAELAGHMAQETPDTYKALCKSIGLTQTEVQAWLRAADAMYLPYDETLGIHEQCDGFLNRPEWDFDGTPTEKYPLLLHYHPLVIYRHQVLKQPDVVLAQVLLPHLFNESDKRRNLAYYGPRTTHDSTLSACMHAVAHAESGDRKKAYAFFEETYRMDLENRHGNTHYGNHMACMAGSWMGLTYGFAGMRFVGGNLSFQPYLPDGWYHYAFKVQAAGTTLKVLVTEDETRFDNEGAAELRFTHYGNTVTLRGGDNIALPNA
ncbi:glycoside hydrolase family 65 protein [Kordiimonas lipolytica]|uniref:Glycoside hydrolase family 65 protein n=1 Tax=Kordiimonas lipolytica TaxID=1662421 RepID=A0ABV8U9U5_9PROT|nr:glycosyl hydrolase family 65 protein [Kordiimonas lipolytica]